MSLTASWVHGNALTVENPERLTSFKHWGWGTVAWVKWNEGTWFHVPLPTPVILNDKRSSLLRVFLMFETEYGSIQEVDVYDGMSNVQQFTHLSLEGEHRFQLDGANTFNLDKPHPVVFGIGVSFFFKTFGNLDSQDPPPVKLMLGSAGGDYTT